MARALKMANRSIESLKDRCKFLGEQVVEQQQIITELQPKANYVDTILQSKSLVTITQIAKDYGMSGRRMNQVLKELKIQYKVGGQWVLYSKHQNNGYVHSRTIDITRTDGRADVTMQTEWTQKGRLFLYEELKKHGYVPVIEQVAQKGELMKKRKIDLDDVAIICGLLSIIINVAFSGKELLANVRWLLSYLGL